jgi:hypothetical protein
MDFRRAPMQFNPYNFHQPTIGNETRHHLKNRWNMTDNGPYNYACEQVFTIVNMFKQGISAPAKKLDRINGLIANPPSLSAL